MNPDLPPNPNAELETKVTALLLGELSAAEAASVRELIAKDAELRRLQERLSLTLNLLRETVATPIGETPAQPAPLKLSPARREKLLAHFKTIAPKEFAQPQKPKVSLLFVLAAAASIMLLASLCLPSLSRAKQKAQRSLGGEQNLAALDRRAPALDMQPPISDGTPVAQSAAPAPSRIVLPQNNEQQLAQANNQNNNGLAQLANNINNSVDNSHASQNTQNGNRQEPGALLAPPAQVAPGGPAGTANFYADKDSLHVFVNADEQKQAKVEANSRSLGLTTLADREGGGGGGGAFGGGSSFSPTTKSVPSSGLLAGGKVPTLGMLFAQEEKLAEAETPVQWHELPAPEAAPASPLAAIDRLKLDGEITGIPSTNANIVTYANPSNISAALPSLNHVNGVVAGTGNGPISLVHGTAAEDEKVGQNDAPLRQPARPAPVPQAEVLTRDNAFTTFSLNISDVAFKLAQASLQNGVMPEAASMRSEEFINAFDYRDPEPAPGAPIGFAWERAGDPFAHNRDLLRFSIKTAAQGRQAGRPLNLVLLLDKSGSMERADRVEIIANALRVLAAQLQPHDTLSVVVFARTARLFVDGVPGSEAGNVAKDLRDLAPEGGTNLEEAMRLAYATALRHYLANGENRVVLLTDGAANLGNVDPNALKQKVESNRKQGIALDCFGVGWDGYNDDLLETLSRAGNGRYGFINTPEEAATEFAGKLAGALRVAAADVKVQVEFNPDRVTSYRQIGYAKDQLKKEDFRDNNVKAAQIGAAESGNALYTVEINPAGEGPLGTVHVRFRVPGTGDYQEHEWTVPYTGSAVPLEKAGAAMRLAATAAAFSEWLAASPYAGDVTPDRLLVYMSGVPQVYGADARPQQLEWMIRQAKSISGK
jgi:Mg-chelatase subunit ChlD